MSEHSEVPEGSVRVALSRPLKVAGKKGIEETKALAFREPTARDIEECGGSPVVLDVNAIGDALPTFDGPKMNRMLARLAGVPLPYIQEMRASDWTNCAWAIAPFFVPGGKT
ncbi:MAG TPA: phage tail assembly protein [Xanthobacteraceae bacterium]|nr:phage tail assembly protein [Xanthobacteraceae bacterium]